MSKLLSISDQQKPCYEIHIEENFSALLPLLRALGYDAQKKVCIITDDHVAPLYGEQLNAQLQESFHLCTMHVIPAGEAHKNTDTVGGAYEHLIRHGFDRKDFLIALGGGVVGDLCGFTAATYLRGIDFVQIPTTLLSQVDSSIGGKTGVDFMQYKNMVGAFYMPKLVYMNLSVLHTLPEEQYRSGMGEILKHGQIKDAAYFNRTAQNYEQILQRKLPVVEQMIYESCQIKGGVVSRDPREQGERALLNFGHTIGHAIEKLSDFRFFHGQCVALGMIAAAYLSSCYGTYPSGQLQRLEEVVQRFGLPCRLEHPEFTPEDVLAATRKDKKMEAGQIKFILLKAPGEAYITKELSEEQILRGIRYLFPDA